MNKNNGFLTGICRGVDSLLRVCLPPSPVEITAACCIFILGQFEDLYIYKYKPVMVQFHTAFKRKSVLHDQSSYLTDSLTTVPKPGFLFTVRPGLTEAPLRAVVSFGQSYKARQVRPADGHLFTSISCSCSWLVEYICCSPCSSSRFRSRRVFPSSAASCRSAGETE